MKNKPRVRMTMDPNRPVKELDERNVTLTCDVDSGNPPTLEAVRWYLDGELLKELPDCPNISYSTPMPGREVETSDLCDIDPSKLMLESVGRSFQGNYTCQGRNTAGWGPQSGPVELHVHYAPGPARLEFDPLVVVKGQALTMHCVVDEMGRPTAQVFRWMRGTHVQSEIRSYNWTIYPVSLETRANFSCQAVNEAGFGNPAFATIDVYAPPTFIQRLTPYTGALFTAKDVSLSCQVECFPLCEIVWLKNGLPLGESDFYSIKTSTLPPDPAKSDFESVLSTLTWNLTAWPNGQLDRLHDNANYTCQSTSNSVGAGVSSTTYFRVEYPPEQVAVSSLMVNVVENEFPDKVSCTAKGFPEPSYIWKFGNQTISSSAVLFLDHKLTRSKAGDYECIAMNRHGNISTKTIMNVQYAPECTITPKEEDDDMLLVCEVEANPGEVDFLWMLENRTYSENVKNKGLSSTITLIASPDNFGKYRCFANNSIGISAPCERVISGANWIRKLSDDKVIIIAAVVGIAIVLFLIVCIIIILTTMPDRRNGKNPSPAHRKGDLNDDGKAFYENLPFHGLQSPQSKPLLPPGSDLDYADSDYRQLYSYGPMNYKQASLQNNADAPPKNNASKSLAVAEKSGSLILSIIESSILPHTVYYIIAFCISMQVYVWDVLHKLKLKSSCINNKKRKLWTESIKLNANFNYVRELL
ncbi:Hemicentin-1 [Orchesella cincta]|uniref:Hemicentin-1 n=1 Tax=Orchesella cincta TaxID=48709 RepID=A0A1D2N3N2_ORCCI|nr:Hemicentin-1 [Orchesella cincta]